MVSLLSSHVDQSGKLHKLPHIQIEELICFFIINLNNESKQDMMIISTFGFDENLIHFWSWNVKLFDC